MNFIKINQNTCISCIDVIQCKQVYRFCSNNLSDVIREYIVLNGKVLAFANRFRIYHCVTKV